MHHEEGGLEIYHRRFEGDLAGACGQGVRARRDGEDEGVPCSERHVSIS